MSDQLEQAIISVLSGINVTAANDYILKFVDTDQSWTASMIICKSRADNDNVRYFAANILYTKVRKNWSQLEEEKREHLYIFLSEIILAGGYPIIPEQNNVLKLFLSRIALTLCCVCSRSTCGIRQFIQIAFSLLEIQPFSSILSSLGLDMLTMAPGEVESLDISRALRIELQDQLLSVLPQVLLLVDKISSSNYCESKFMEAIRLLSSWLGQGVTLSVLFEDHSGTFNCLWKGIQSGHEGSIIQCCTLLREVLCLSEFPRTATRDRAVMEIVRMFTSSGPALAPFFAADKASDNAAHEICSCLVALVSHETATVSSPGNCCPELFLLLLSCVAQRPRKIAALTFDAWLALQDLPVASRHPMLHRQIFSSLLNTIVVQCQYPDGFTDWDCADDDEDDFLAFRDHRQGLQEVAVTCFYSLQEEFFECLTNRLKASDSWSCLEAVLCVLSSVMDCAKSEVSSCRSSDPPVLLLLEAAHRVISTNLASAPAALVESACKFLGCITFFVVQKQRPPDLFFPSLEFLFKVFASNLVFLGGNAGTADAIEKVVSKSIHQLCIRGAHLFDASAQQKVAGLVELTAQILSGRCDSADDRTADSSPSVLLLVEAATRTITIAEVDTELAGRLVAVLGRPIIMGLTAELDLASPNTSKVEMLLGAATQMIKFSDQVKKDQGQLIGEFLSVLWPLLERIPRHATFGATASVTNQLFGLFSSSLLSAKALMLPQVCGMASVVMSYLHMSLSVVGSPQLLNSSPNAIQCAGSMVEALAGREDGVQLLSSLLDQITEALLNALHCDFQQHQNSSTGSAAAERIVDAETIEKYFGFVYLYLLLCPELLPVMAVTLRKAIYILWRSLCSYKERGALRAALQVLQCVFLPSTARLAEQRSVLLDLGCEMGEEIVNQILRSICGEVQSSLVPNLVEGLLCVMSGCEDSAHRDQSRAWVFSALSDSSISGLQHVTGADKQMVLTNAFRLAGSDKRRCKALLHDFAKICSSESTPDCLLAYEE